MVAMWVIETLKKHNQHNLMITGLWENKAGETKNEWYPHVLLGS
jgi:hypothetical protein